MSMVEEKIPRSSEGTLGSGVRFADYNNYKPNNPEVDVRDLDKTFEKVV